MIIYNLPNQTAKSDSQVSLSFDGKDKDQGETNIDIPGIGSGHLQVSFMPNHASANDFYTTIITGLPGQVAKGDDGIVTAADVCDPGEFTLPDIIDIPGIGGGYLTITKVN